MTTARKEKRPLRAGILSGLQAGLVVRVQLAAGDSTQMLVARARASHRWSFIQRWGCFMRRSSVIDWGLAVAGRPAWQPQACWFHRFPCAGASSMEGLIATAMPQRFRPAEKWPERGRLRSIRPPSRATSR